MFKKLNQKGISALIIVIIVAVVAAVAGVGFVLYSRSSSETLTVDEITSDSLAKLEPPYRLEMKITDDQGVVSNVNIEAQDANTQRAVITSEAGSIETITTSDSIYAKFGDKFTKIARTDQDAGNPADEFVLDQSDIDRVTSGGEVIGKADCRGMTCTEIKFTDERGDEWRIFVENSTKRIIRSTGNTKEGQVVLEFYYEDVNVTVPSDDQVQSIENFDLNSFNLDSLGL